MTSTTSGSALGEAGVHSVTRTATAMADGRELIYFDETPDAERVLVDRRDLPPVIPGSQVRYDALTGEWVGIAGHRQTRIYHPPANACPLCPTTTGNASEIPSPDYDVVVFENRFPSFAGTGETAAGGGSVRHPGRQRPLRGGLLHLRPQRHPVRAAHLADANGDRGVGRPHRRVVRAARGRAGLLLREPRRGNRRHPGPPTRADLRVPVRDPENGRGHPFRAGAPGGQRHQPVCRPTGRRTRRRLPDRRAERALGGLRALCGPLASRGPSVSTAPGPRPHRTRHHRTGRAGRTLSGGHPPDGGRLR